MMPSGGMVQQQPGGAMPGQQQPGPGSQGGGQPQPAGARGGPQQQREKQMIWKGNFYKKILLRMKKYKA